MRRLAGEHLVQHRRERVDVTPCVRIAVPCRLLRAHILRCAEGQAGRRDAVPAGGTYGERNPEVGDQRLPVLEKDIPRLDVTVDNLVPVSVVEGASYLPRDLQRLHNGEQTLPPQALPQ